MSAETQKSREKRVVIYCIAGLCVFAVLAGISGSPEFLFALITLMSLLIGRYILFHNQKYMAASFKHHRGEFKAFPFIQLSLLIPLVAISVAIGYGVVKVVQNIL